LSRKILFGENARGDKSIKDVKNGFLTKSAKLSKIRLKFSVFRVKMWRIMFFFTVHPN